jgi:hypothetical protein
MDMPCCLALEGFFHGWGRELGPFFFFSSRFLHAVADAGHPLGGLADVADCGGRFSLAQKGQGQLPSYIKAKCKLNLSQLGPWPLKGQLSMRALAVGRPCDGPNGAAGYPAPALIPPAPPWDRGRPAGGRGVGPWYSNGDVRAPTSKIA